MAEAVLQGDTAKLWDLITAAIEGGFIHHLGLNPEDAGKMRGRNLVKNKKVEPQKGDDGKDKCDLNAIDGEQKRKVA